MAARESSITRAPRGARLATAVAYAVSPPVLAPLLFGLVLAAGGAAPRTVGATMAAALLCFGLIPLGYVGWLVRRGEVASLEVRDRAKRGKAFFVGTLSSAVGVFVVMAVAAGPVRGLAGALAACIALNSLLLGVATRHGKISIHAATVAGFAAMLGVVAWAGWPGLHLGGGWLRPSAVVGLLLVPLVMWARVRAGAHTRGEVAAGALFGLILPVIELTTLRRFDVFTAVL